jgi:opacity protein-like surface antigen
MRIVLALAAVLLASSAMAEDRVQLLPSTMKGNWFASPTSTPTSCDGDGWFMAFSDGTKKVSVSVTQRTGQKYSTSIVTVYEILKAPDGAPAKIGLFLKGPQQDVGVALINNMQAEWIPAGADKAYPAPTMHLRRC